MFRNLRIILILAISLLVTACMDATCIDADDFGFSHVKIAAHNESPMGAGGSQYVNWQDSGLTLSGSNLHMIIKNWDPNKNINTSAELSAWCPWLGPVDKGSRPSMSDICVMLDNCYFQDGDTCSKGKYAKILNAPCILQKGIGLYMLAAPKNFDPNQNFDTNQAPQLSDPRVIIAHMGSKVKNSLGEEVDLYDLQIDPVHNSSSYVKAGGFLNIMTTTQKLDLTGGKLWFKILDHYYQDNSGQYIVQVKSGVTTSEWDPTSWAVDLVRAFFFGNQGNNRFSFNEAGLVKQIFNNVVRQPSYRLMVSSLLTAYIMFYAFNFLIGNVKMSQSELLSRVVKALIISQLLTAETSWTFFNDYLFSYFISGSKSMIDLISTAGGGTGSGPSSIISFMLSPHTIIKLLALLLVSPVTFGWGLLYVIVYFVALLVIFWGLFYSAVIQILCLVMMGLIIATAPIFFCFLLFDQTRPLFENWLRQLISFFVQSLLVVTAVTMMGMLVKHQIYQTLGFRVCKANVLAGARTENSMNFKLRGADSRTADLYVWKAQYTKHNEATGGGEQLTNILIPEAHFEGDNQAIISSREKTTGKFCAAYECAGMRYPSFPFLDPNVESDMKRLRGFWAENFTPLEGVGTLLLCGLLIMMFMNQATKIGQFIAGGTYDAGKAGGAVAQELWKNVSAPITAGRSSIMKKMGSTLYKGMKGSANKGGPKSPEDAKGKTGDSVSGKSGSSSGTGTGTGTGSGSGASSGGNASSAGASSSASSGGASLK